LTVYSPGDDATPAERTVHENEVYRTVLLPGFELPLAELLAAADLWGDTGNS